MAQTCTTAQLRSEVSTLLCQPDSRIDRALLYKLCSTVNTKGGADGTCIDATALSDGDNLRCLTDEEVRLATANLLCKLLDLI